MFEESRRFYIAGSLVKTITTAKKRKKTNSYTEATGTISILNRWVSNPIADDARDKPCPFVFKCGVDVGYVPQ